MHDQFSAKALIDNWDEASAWLESCFEQADAPMKTSISMMIACEEQYVNMAHYAYPGIEPGEIRIGFDFDETTRVARIAFEDDGVFFDPFARPDPDITLSAEERKIGGLGIYMIKKTADGVEYDRVDGRTNRVTLIKQL